jgi:site-specific recombinase XerC
MRAFYDSVSYLRAIRRAQERIRKQQAADGKHMDPLWTPHQLRHARGTLVRAKHGLEAAQAALGHARMDSTQIYAQRLRESARAVALDMG